MLAIPKRIKDLTGKTFGRWTVLGLGKVERRYRADRDNYENLYYWTCQCSCESKEVRDVLQFSLTHNRSLSCGCLVKEVQAKRLTKHGHCKRSNETYTQYHMWEGAKLRAAKKKLPFNIDIEDVVIPDVCPIFGFKLVPQKGRGTAQDDSPTLDKIDPTKGYVKGNVWVISKLANTMKSSASKDQLLTFAKNITKIFSHELHPHEHA